MTLIRHHDIDIYHRSTKQAPGILRGVLLANENEHGHAGYLTIKGLVAGRTPDFYINSKLLGNITFNQTVNPATAGWEGWYLKTENANEDYWAVVNINEWPTTGLFPVEDSKNTWIYAYPVVRDVLDFFSTKHAEQVLVLTNSAIHEVLDPEEFRQMKENEFVSYDWNYSAKPNLELQWAKNDGGAFFTPPAWMFPYFAKQMDYKAAKTFMVGYNDDKEINDVAGHETLKEVASHLGMRVTKNHEDCLLKAVDEMDELTKKANEVRQQIEELAKGKPPANNTMWG